MEKVVDILLVEDNPSDAELTVRAIKKNKLVNPIFVAKDGQEALDFMFGTGGYTARTHEKMPRMVLLDLKLPKVSGLEVLKELKSNERTRAIPVIILTSSKEDPDIKAAYELGANSYVVKPVEFNSFIDALSQIGFYWLLLNEYPA